MRRLSLRDNRRCIGMPFQCNGATHSFLRSTHPSSELHWYAVSIQRRYYLQPSTFAPSLRLHLAPRPSRLAPRASRLSPRPSRLAPRASRLAPLASRLSPLASRLASPLAPRASPLAPLASRLAPRPSPLAPRPSPLAPTADIPRRAAGRAGVGYRVLRPG